MRACARERERERERRWRLRVFFLGACCIWAGTKFHGRSCGINDFFTNVFTLRLCRLRWLSWKLTCGGFIGIFGLRASLGGFFWIIFSFVGFRVGIWRCFEIGIYFVWRFRLLRLRNIESRISSWLTFLVAKLAKISKCNINYWKWTLCIWNFCCGERIYRFVFLR